MKVRTPIDPWEEYRDPETGKLLFKVNRETRELEIGSRGHLHRVSLDKLDNERKVDKPPE